MGTSKFMFTTILARYMDQQNDVTVRVYIGGVMEYEETKPISGEDTYTLFATVEWGEETHCCCSLTIERSND